MHGWAENIPSCIFAFIILLFLQKELAAIQESFQGEHAVMAIYSSVCLSMYPLLLRINGSHVNFLKSCVYQKVLVQAAVRKRDEKENPKDYI